MKKSILQTVTDIAERFEHLTIKQTNDFVDIYYTDKKYIRFHKIFDKNIDIDQLIFRLLLHLASK